MVAFRDHHLFNLLHQYEEQQAPLDYFISKYFRGNKSLGSKDRAYIADAVYGMIRWKALLDFLADTNSWEARFNVFQKADIFNQSNNPDIPLHVRLSFPEHLLKLLIKSHGLEKAMDLCKISNTTAPTTIRANLLKTTRDQLLHQLSPLYKVDACAQSPVGMNFSKKINFFILPEFKNGLFEIQDEGSQLIAQLVKASPGDLVLDYCAGAGGKTLAFAPKMENKGQIFLHDIRHYSLQEAKKRLRRAGIQNAQIAPSEDPKLKKLKKKMDWVLADVPCSGTGTLRRNPDMKWKFSEEMFSRLLGQQRSIFEKALSYVKPGGKIVYATCSILNEENQDQMSHFLKTYPIQLESEPFQTNPTYGQMDGFFAAVFTNR